MTSRRLTPYQPPTHDLVQVEYEVSHLQNCGQDQLLFVKIGTFPTLQDAQDAAQDILRSVLNQYVSRGWSGYYCNDIDLELSGLITGLVGEQQYEYLSEVHIDAMERVYQPSQAQLDSEEAWVLATGCDPVDTNFGYITHSTYNTVVPTEMLDPRRPASAFMRPQQDVSSSSRRTEGFSQNPPQYFDRASSFIPCTSAPYDQSMSFSALSNDDSIMKEVANPGHTRRESRPKRHGKHKRASSHSKRVPGTGVFLGDSLGGVRRR